MCQISLREEGFMKQIPQLSDDNNGHALTFRKTTIQCLLRYKSFITKAGILPKSFSPVRALGSGVRDTYFSGLGTISRPDTWNGSLHVCLSAWAEQAWEGSRISE